MVRIAKEQLEQRVYISLHRLGCERESEREGRNAHTQRGAADIAHEQKSKRARERERERERYERRWPPA